MKRDTKLSLLTGLICGALVFIVIYITERSLTTAAAFGIVIAVVSFIVAIKTFYRSHVTQNKLEKQLSGQEILYSDIAGFMINGKEISGSLALTSEKLFFLPNSNDASLEIGLVDIASATIQGGMLVLTNTAQHEATFKVMNAQKIIQLMTPYLSSAINE